MEDAIREIFGGGGTGVMSLILSRPESRATGWPRLEESCYEGATTRRVMLRGGPLLLVSADQVDDPVGVRQPLGDDFQIVLPAAGNTDIADV